MGCDPTNNRDISIWNRGSIYFLNKLCIKKIIFNSWLDNSVLLIIFLTWHWVGGRLRMVNVWKCLNYKLKLTKDGFRTWIWEIIIAPGIVEKLSKRYRINHQFSTIFSLPFKWIRIGVTSGNNLPSTIVIFLLASNQLLNH